MGNREKDKKCRKRCERTQERMKRDSLRGYGTEKKKKESVVVGQVCEKIEERICGQMLCL